MQQIRNDGTRGLVVPFLAEKMEEMLKDPETKEVRVFHLKQGMVIEIEGLPYKVIRVRPNGKAALKPLKKGK